MSESNRLPTDDKSSNALSYPMAEEFHVIGVRPMEFRPAVIRRAMNRSATPLATAHLQNPDGAVEKKLALVATTGYRLLDPRRREDLIHRIMLGRIHPQLADEAARIAQSKGNQLTEMELMEGDDTYQFNGGGLLKTRGQAKTRGQRHSHQNCFFDDSVSLWNDSLRSPDLLVERPLKRLFRTTRRWALQRYIAVASVSGLVLMMLGTWRFTRDGDAVEVAAVSPDTDSSTRRNGATGPIKAIDDRQLSVVQSASKPIPDAPKQAEIALTSFSELAPEPVVSPPIVHAIIAAEADEGGKGGDAIASGDDRTASVNMPDGDVKAELAPTPVSNEPISNEPVSNEPASDQPISNEPASDQPIPGQPANKQPVPVASELSARQVIWAKSLDQVAAGDLLGKSAKSMQFADDAVGGPNDRWIGWRGAAMYSVLAGKFADSDRVLQRMTETFETNLAACSKDVAIECMASPMQASDATNVIDWLETWFGRSLVAGELEDAAFFALYFDQVAKSYLDRTKTDLSKEIASSLDIARRLAETTLRIESADTESVTPGERLAAGRYWGLVRRQWAKALPYLTAGGDARLASLATSETLLGGSPQPNELIDLAEDYLALARKSKGWQKSSYILHADEILHRDTASGSDVEALELRRVQKLFRADHESIFTLADGLVVAQPAPAVPLKEPAPTLTAKKEIGLFGRIRVAGEDVGVLVRYEPGARLTAKMLDQIASELKVDLSKSSLQFVGMISVDHPTAITVQASNVVIDGQNSVSLDDHVLKPVASQTVSGNSTLFRADLAPGQWTIRWTVPAVDQFGSTLQVMDSLSRIPVTVQNPPQTIKDHPDSLPTRLRVSVITDK